MPQSPSPTYREFSATPDGNIVDVRSGETFRVKLPLAGAEWQVDFAAEVLRMVTPQGEAKAPGAEGWLFEGIATGETDVRVTEISQGGGGAPARPRSFVLTVRVR
jgi:hypothetical protein